MAIFKFAATSPTHVFLKQASQNTPPVTAL